jgi:hypothetical protein
MSTIDVAKLFFCEFFCLHGLPKEIILWIVKVPRVHWRDIGWDLKAMEGFKTFDMV